MLVGNVYLLVFYQHPEDRNQARACPQSCVRRPHAPVRHACQAYFPKLVVVLGLTLAFLSVLMLPLDVANRDACDASYLLSSCHYTLPMTELWTYTYVVMIVWVTFVIPFTMFYYETDSEQSAGKALFEAAQYWLVTVVVFAILLAIGYSVGGYLEFEMQTLNSGFTPVATVASQYTGCVPYDGALTTANLYPQVGKRACDSPDGAPGKYHWQTRATFPIYVIAFATVVGWLLFMVFAGVGFVAMPADLIGSYMRRPKTTITKTEYIRLAGEIGKKAKALLGSLREAQLEVRRSGRTRRSRRAIAALGLELVHLEDEELKLREVYPQSEDAEITWVVTVCAVFCVILF